METKKNEGAPQTMADVLAKMPERWFTTEEMVEIVRLITRTAVRETLEQLGYRTTARTETEGKEKAEGEPGSEPWLSCGENPEVAKAIAQFAENLPDRFFSKREVAAVMAYMVGETMTQTMKLMGQPKAKPTKTEE